MGAVAGYDYPWDCEEDVRMIEIECPCCHGSGAEYWNDDAVERIGREEWDALPEETEKSECVCERCGGAGYVTEECSGYEADGDGYRERRRERYERVA